MRLPLALFLFAAAAPAAAADRNYSVTSFDRIRVEGPYAVSLAVGVPPFARASGSQRGIDGISLRVEGRTLIIRADRSAWGGDSRQPAGPVTIRVGTPALATASLSGPGSLAIDRVRGLQFVLSVIGSGQSSIARAEVDQLRVVVSGSGGAIIAGRAGTFSALAGGAARLDAAGLKAKDVAVGASGPATVTIEASNSAKVTASGTATVTVGGKPACTLKVSGSASVSGCR